MATVTFLDVLPPLVFFVIACAIAMPWLAQLVIPKQKAPDLQNLSSDDAMKISDELILANRLAEAETVMRAVVLARPHDESALHKLAITLIEQETPEKCQEAIAYLERAGTWCRDELVAISCNMGKGLGESGQTTAAQRCYEGVLRSYPGHSLARKGRGLTLMQQGLFRESMLDFDAVLKAEPDNYEARFARGFARLVLGNYKEGFIDYEFRRKELINPIKQPLWHGDMPLVGKTILVHGEQGLGDNIQFSRYLPKLVELGANVVGVFDKNVGPLIEGTPGVTIVSEDRATWPHFDCWIRMMSLAGAFGTTVETVPPPLALDLPQPSDDRAHREMYGRNSNARHMPKRMKIGLCWAGSPHSKYDSHRSIPLEYLEPLIRDSDANFYSLQLDVRDSDCAAWSKLSMIKIAPILKNFRDTAVAIADLDLVITVDTSVAHLAGTVGVPTWVMINAFRTYWVWIQGLEYSPWYPSARVFQQKTNGDWPELISRVQRQLKSAMSQAA